MGAHLSFYLGLCFLSFFIYFTISGKRAGGSLDTNPLALPWWLARGSRHHFESKQASMHAFISLFGG